MDLAGNLALGAGPSSQFIVDSGTFLRMDHLGFNVAKLGISGVPSVLYEIESTPNLAGPIWQLFGTASTDTNCFA